ncbi:MAG: SusC/RagA family TonB-linked outer membrane protein [Chitinophagaceae bacterium]|nr:SusC/RagA family TonB-linked outer membrane protein [Chitinophagaceae bacterium]
MKKLTAFLCLSMLVLFTYGQTKTVTGVVTDADGKPVSYATITESGKKNAVTADADGRFSIKVSENSKLLISASGFESFTTDAGSGSFKMVRKDGSMNEVVVTALGIRRSRNTLPYAAQQVSGDDVSRARGSNVASALSGKVSGLQIIQGNSIGGSTNVVIRGVKSLTGNNQALFVVDGVPINNANNNAINRTPPDQKRRDQTTGGGGYDYGNAAADINPDDIESLTVLKGAAATALYGSRAANGVIMITTKKAKRGVGITINSGFVVGSIDKSTFPKYQTQYGAGYSSPYDKDGFFYFDVNGDGIKDYVTPTTEDASYGAKFDPSLMVYQWDAFDKTGPNYHKARPWVAAANNPTSFYISPVSNNNSVFLDGVSEKGSYKLGYTRNDEKGVLPNSKILKNIINFGSSYNITEKLTASASANYSKIDGRGRYGTGYNGRNVNQNFRQWYQTNVDLKEQKEAYFRNYQNVTWNWSNPRDEQNGLKPIYTDNYYWMVYQQYETDTRGRIFGNVSLNYKFNDWLNLMARVSLDTYDELQEERIAKGSNIVPMYSRFNHSYTEKNYDVLANFDKDLSTNFNLKALAGINLRRISESSMLALTNGGLIGPGIYSLANSLNPINAPTETNTPRAVDGYFGGATLGYKGFLTLDGTIRRDRSSTLPVQNNAYNYYAVSGSWIFSKQLAVPWLSSGKLRMNYATVGNDAPWGSILDAYNQPPPFGSAVLFSLPGTKNFPELKPEYTKSKEIGLEMAFLKNRVGFDITFYQTNTTNQIIPVALSTATGFNSKFANAGDIQNKGIELSMFGSPFKTRDFSWDININWTRNRNEVLKLFEDSKNLVLGTFQGGVSLNATLGQPYGILQGKTWGMIDPKDPTKTVAWDGTGEKLVKANGRYFQTTTTNNIIGNVNPDWIGGIYNTVKYKGIGLGFLIDIRSGGDVFSLDRYYGLATGITVETVQLNDLGNPSRNTIANGGGIIVPGVTQDGKPNTNRVENNYGTYGYSQNPAAAFVYDASYVKLREAVLSYAIPEAIYGKVKFVKGAEVSVIGRNLWIIHKNLPYSDPEENLSSGNIQGYQSGAYPTTRSIGANLKLKF